MARHNPAIWALACLLALSLCAEEKAAKGNGAAFLVIDYLPPAIYDGDGLSACFRVENASAREASIDVVAKSRDGSGTEIKSQIEKSTVKAGAFAPVKFEIDAKRVATIQFELKKDGDEAPLATQSIALVREDDPWPRTKIVNGRMTLADSGSIAIPVVQKKRTVEVRQFAPLQWIFGSSNNDGGAAAGKSRVFVPGTWSLSGARSVVPVTSPANSTSPVSAKPKKLDDNEDDAICTLGPWPLDGSIPILNGAGQILGEVAAAGGVQRVVILLPPEDLDLATDPRIYRVALDALLARLTKARISRIVLIAPFRYGCNEAHRKALWREVHESAAANSVRAIDPNDWMGEAQWRADPATPKIYATRPNAPGRKIIEQALANLIR